MRNEQVFSKVVNFDFRNKNRKRLFFPRNRVQKLLNNSQICELFNLKYYICNEEEI